MILPGVAFGLAALMYSPFSASGRRSDLIMLGPANHHCAVSRVARLPASLSHSFYPALLESSASLGASWFYTLRRVTLPEIIAPMDLCRGRFSRSWHRSTVPVSLFLSGPVVRHAAIRLLGACSNRTLRLRVAASRGFSLSTVILLMLVLSVSVVPDKAYARLRGGD